jgi:hypothetical protein
VHILAVACDHRLAEIAALPCLVGTLSKLARRLVPTGAAGQQRGARVALHSAARRHQLNAMANTTLCVSVRARTRAIGWNVT